VNGLLNDSIAVDPSAVDRAGQVVADAERRVLLDAARVRVEGN
jgi:hypothetical protein